MGVWQQFRLLLNKNLLLRWRHPGTLLLEVVWPVLIIAIVALIRLGVPPLERPTCHYQDRAMPSAGLVPFLQTFVCNLDNKCHTNDSKYQVEANAGSVSALVQQVTPYLSDEGTMDMLDSVDRGYVLITTLTSLIKDNSLMKDLDNMTRLSSYFRDPEKLKRTLVQDYTLSQDAVDALMASQANISAIMDLSGYPDLKGVACDPGRLRRFLYFPEGTNVTEVSRSLCDIDPAKIPDITRFLQDNLDVAEIIRLLGVFESLKARLSQDYSWANGLRDVADMLDLLMSMDDLGPLIKDLSSVRNLPDIIRSIPRWIQGLQASDVLINPLSDLVNSIDPLVSSLFPNDSMWMSMKEAMVLGTYITNFTQAQMAGSFSSAHFLQTATSFIRDIDHVFKGLSPELRTFLNSLSNVNWTWVVDPLFYRSDLSQTELLRMLDDLQKIMQPSSLWTSTVGYLAVAKDLLHSLNLMMSELLEVREELKQLLSGAGPLKGAVEQLLDTGPNVTLAVLKAFTRPDTLAKLLADGGSYPAICTDLMRAIEGDVGATVSRQLQNTLCSGDMADTASSLLKGFDTKNISASLDQTVSSLMALFSGNSSQEAASLAALWQEVEQMMQNVDILSNTSTASWAHMLSATDVLVQLMNNHSREWEPVLDMLDVNYVGSSMLGLFGAAGRLMNDSSSAQWMQLNLGPYVHMAASMMKGMYNHMGVMKATYSKDSPLGQLVYYSSTYAPQLATAIMAMPASGNADMVYKMISSADPMSVLCGEHMMQHMNLPSDVAAQLETVVCVTNWTTVQQNLMMTSQGYTSLVENMMKTMSSMSSMSSMSMEADWAQLTYYTSLVMDLMTSSDNTRKDTKDPMPMLEMVNQISQGPWSLTSYANLTQVFVAVDMAMKHMMNMTLDDLNFFVNIAGRALARKDQEMSARTPTTPEQWAEAVEWKRLKYYFKMIEDVNVIIVEEFQRQKDMSVSLAAVINMYPEEIQQMVRLAAEAYLELIDASKNMILDPEKLIRRLASQSVQLPNCGTVTVASNWLMLQPDSHFARLERQVCSANWTDISTKMATTSLSQASGKAMEELVALVHNLDKLQLNPVVNWTGVLNSCLQTTQLVTSQLTAMQHSMASFDLRPFNMTAINAKWARFFADMEQLKNLDTTRLSASLSELQMSLMQTFAGQVMDNGELLRMLHANNFLSKHILDFVNIQLKYMNSTSRVNILDMLGSDELRKVAQVLRYSPEINQLGVNTLIGLLSDPSKAAASMDLPSLCTNQTLFRQVVAVNDSVISTPLLQQTVCNLNINSTLLLQQLQQNWDGFSELLQAFDMLMQPNSSLMVNATMMTATQLRYSALLESLIQHPPTIALFSDDRWMNASRYEGPWLQLGKEMEKLYQQYQDPKFLMGNLGTIIKDLAKNPEMLSTLATLDVLLDTIHSYLSSAGGVPTSFDGYPNMGKFYSLLDQLPELLEMVAYTSMRHAEQINNWAGAMTSWETFCSADPSTLMTAPPGGGLNVRQVVGQLCAINFTQLALEVNTYQGMDKLTAIMAGGGLASPVNVTALAEKLDRVLSDFEGLNSTFTSMDSSLRFLNSTTWAAVLGRLEKEFNQTLQSYMSPEALLKLLMNTSPLFQEFKGLQITVEQVMAVTEVILDQVLQSVQGGSLRDFFSKYPTLLSVVTLMDELPAMYETLAYTGLYTPEKLAQMTQILSYDAFCRADMAEVLTVPPQSSYNLTTWQHRLCSLNLTLMMAELADYQGTAAIANILAPNATVSVNVTAVSKKIEQVISEIGRVMSGSVTSTPMNINNYLNLTAWGGVMQRLQIWMQDSSQLWASPSRYKKLLSASVLATVQRLAPEMNTALAYTSAILDLFQQQLERSNSPLSESFAQYPNMKTLLSLLEDVPEIFEIFAFTTLQHQEQVARWTPAMASWETFCSYDPSSLLTAPSGSSVSVGSVLQRLCSLNITQLMTELNQYQSMETLQALLTGNSTEAVNTTAIAEKMSSLIDSMATLSSSPMDSGVNLRIFNQSVWEQVFQRLGQDLNNTQQQFMSPATLLDFYNKLFGSYSELNDTQQTLNKVWAVTDVVLDQMLRSFQGGNLKDMFSQYPTLQSVVGLLDYLPEIYETVMYTALYAPEKVVKRTDAFSSLVAFCTTDMSTLFTVPPGVTFDLKAWQISFCTLNLTTLMEELAQYQGSQDIANIFSANSTVRVDITSVVRKLESVLSKLTTMNASSTSWQSLDGRFLNTTLWDQAISNLQQWTANPSTLFWMRTDKVLLLYGDLMKDPSLAQQLAFMQPLYSTMALLMDKIFLYENKTSMTLEQLFIGAPEMQKLIGLLQEPGVIDVLLESANTEKFAPLLTANMTTALIMLCHPLSNLSDYLTVPAGLSIDLTSLRTKLCAINLLKLPQEVMDFFDVERLTAAMNGSLPVDYVALSQDFTRLSLLITRWTQSPPVITLPANWQNESFWLGILERYGMARQNTSVVIAELERFTTSLGPLMTQEPMRRVGLVVQTVLRLLNENLLALQSQNLTLENLVQRVPILHDVFSALGVEGDILDAMLKMPVQSSQMLIEALLTNGTTAQQSVCDMNKLREMLKLPVSFNTSALYQAVCLKDTTEAVNNLVTNLDLQSLIVGLDSPLAVANWSAVFRQSEELQQRLQNLMTHPPTFNASSLMAMLESSFNTSDPWQIANMFNIYQLLNSMNGQPELKILQDMLKVEGVILEFLNEMMGRFVVNAGTLDLASLFSASPSFVKLMNAALHTKPDLATALASMQLNPLKIDQLISLSPDNLQSVMCSPSQFQEYFLVADNTNITEVLTVLCSLNFTQLAEELSQNFMVDALTKKFAMAMNATSAFNLQKYITMGTSMVGHIMNLTTAQKVTFNGNHLQSAFDINVTSLIEAMESVSAQMQAQYQAYSSATLNNMLAGFANFSDGHSVILGLRFMELYLHSLRGMLEDISSRPISVAAIVNNTEVGNIITPFLQNPQSLQELLDLVILPQKLSALLTSPDPVEALCGPQLFSVFAAPGNESGVLKQLQTSVCASNATVMMWQAVMGQANGYQLYLQMEALTKQIKDGKASINVSAIDSDMRRIIDLVTQLVMEYQNGTRSTEQFLDWRSFQNIFNQFSASIGGRLMNMSQQWPAQLTSALLPSFANDPMSANVRIINTVNIFMGIINDRLDNMIKDGVSLYTLLNNSATLVNLMEAYLDVTRLSPQGWLDNQFNISRVVEVSVNNTLLMTLCTSNTLAAYLADGSPNTLSSAMQTVMCSVTTELPAAFRQFIDYQALQTQVTEVWNMSVPVQVQYQQYVANVARFNTLITRLASTPPPVHSQLTSKLDFSNMLQALQNIATRPEMLFRLLKGAGLVLDGPLSTSDMQNVLYGMNMYLAQPVLTLVESMDKAGVSISQVMQDPFKLLEALPVLMNFDMQFGVLASAYLQPLMNIFWNREDFRKNKFCNGQLPAEVFNVTGVDPAVVNKLCTVPTTQWIQTLKELNYTEPQILSWVAQVDAASKSSLSCNTSKDAKSGREVEVCSSTSGDLVDNKGMYWMRLMTTLESLSSHLMPKDGKTSAAGAATSLNQVVEVLRDAFLNKSLDSAMNYLELVDRTGLKSRDWLMFKQIMSFLQAAGSLLNSGMQKMTGPSATIQLQNLLPDSQKLADLLLRILGPASASEMLAASVSPQLFYHLSSMGQLQSVTCDPVQFSAMFHFPPGTNVTAVQLALCAAAAERASEMQELIDLFQAGDVLVQLDHLMRQNFTSVAGNTDLWQTLRATVSHMFTYLEQLQSSQVNGTVSQAWLDLALQQLVNLNTQSATQLDTLCRSYVAIGGPTAFQESRSDLVIATRVNTLVTKIVTKIIPLVSKLDDLMCSILTKDGLDLVAGVNFLRQNGLDDVLQEVSMMMQDGPQTEFQCSEIILSAATMNAWITNMTQSLVPVNVDRLGQCMAQSSGLFADVLHGFNQLYRVMDDMDKLLDDKDLAKLMRNSGQLGEVISFLLKIMSREKTVMLQLTDLLANTTDVQTYLTGVMKLAPEAVTTLLDSTINLNATMFLNHAVSELVSILCDPTQLANVMSLPSFSPFNISAISAMLCTADVNVTAGVLRDAGKSADLLARLTSLAKENPTEVFASTLTREVTTLISELQGFSSLIHLMNRGFDVKVLMDNADSIDAILAGGGTIQKIVQSLTALVGTLKSVVPPENHNVITSMQKFISGLVGLDLIQSYLAEAIHVSDLQKDAGALRRYLIEDLKFSPKAATALLSSTYSIRVFLNASGLVESDEPCEKRLLQFVLMNSTQQVKDEVTSTFCGLNKTQLTQFMQVMVPELDIGTLIQKYVTHSGDAILKSVNLTKAEAKQVLQSLSSGGQSLEEATTFLLADNSSFSALLSDMNHTAQGEFDAMVALQPVLCGVSDMKVGDQFDLDSKVDGAQSEKDLAEEAQLSGQFCKDMYRKLKGASMGAVIWAYVKPVMSGKILFTPDTPVTRKIVTKANWVFDTLSEVKRVSKKWSEKVPSLVSLSSTANQIDEIEAALSNSFVQGILKSAMGVEPSSITNGLASLKNNSFSAGGLDSLQRVAQLIYNYTTCLDLDRFEAAASEEELEKRAFQLYKTNSFLGGIVFMNVEDSSSSSSSSSGRKKRQADSGSLPPHIQYKIRMDMDNVPTTNRIKDRLWMPYSKDNFASDLRYMRGFIQLQDMVEGAIMKLQTNGSFSPTGVSMQQMPFPCHTEDDYIHFLGSYLLPILMTFAWLAAIGVATRNLVYDRQSGQEESLRIMGMISGLNMLMWFLVTVLLMAFVALIVTIIFKYSGVFPNSSGFLLYLYFLDFCFSTTMMCYFISAFFSRVTLAILSVVIIYFLSFMPYIILISAEVVMTHWQKSLACLSSTTAFSFGAIFVTRFEEETVGLQWEKMHDKIDDSVTFSWMCYMMLIDSAIYLVLGWYIRNVKPGKYGVSQPWYFPVLPSYWCACLSGTSRVQPLPPHYANESLFEPEPQGLDIGISLRDLRKKFKGKVEVVQGVSVNIYHDQITTLLGHNGAAKTTTLNMLVGVLEPTEGEVLVEGRKTTGRTGLLGICPQHNVLYEFMTVNEHMNFYGGVKGHLSDVELQREIRKLLQDVDLWHVKDVPALDLSGGMQRRLCVALAFVGGSKTVVLDEPTSGVDPHARKNIWNLILKNRPGRTILMSTHHLDEADMLSDRILVMHTGRLLAAGSPGFLKDQLGGGYKLTIHSSPALHVQHEVASPNGQDAVGEMSSQHGKILAFIQSTLPSAKFLESVGSDLTVSVPSHRDSSYVLSQFFRHLDTQKEQLGVLSYGVSNTTLEEVFLKLTAEANGAHSNDSLEHSTTDSEAASMASDNTILKPSEGRPPRSVKGASLKFQQLGALLVKRVHHYRRNWRMLISTLLLPLLAFLCAMGFSVLRPTQADMRDLIMTPALYAQNMPASYAFIQDNAKSPVSGHFMDTLKAAAPGIGTTCMQGFDAGKGFKCVAEGSMHESQKMQQACQCSDYDYLCSDGQHREGVRQMLTRPDITLQDLTYKNLDKYLTDSYLSYIDERFGGWSLEPPKDNSSQAKVWFNNKGYHAIPSYFNAFSNNLLRSSVSSAEAHKYGITLYNHPLMLNSEQLSKESLEASATDIGIAMVILLALSFIPSAFMVYLTNERVSQEKHLQSISGVGTIMYWSTSLLWDLFVYSCVLAVMVVIVVIFRTDGFYDRNNLGAFALLVFLYGWAVIPLMYCTLRLFNTGSAAYLTLFCLNMLMGLLPTICIFVLNLLSSNEDLKAGSRVMQYVLLVFPQYALGIGLVDLVANQVQYKLLRRFGEDTYVDPFDLEMLGWNFVALAVEGLVFIVLTFLIHSFKERAISMTSGMHYNAAKEDEDVAAEQDRVHAGEGGDSLAVKGLCKVYRRGLKRFCAVNNLSFGVNKGECFGLLGVNGAGKTTTFKMLTRASAPSEGGAIVQQRQLSALRSHLGDEMGYCPQENALDMYLTGRQTLTFHAKLRGFGSDQIEALVSEQLKLLQLESLADKPVHTYSGGNKRKLSLAVAMLGQPPLLLLDEPTTGMDPATRRLVWRCILMATQRGQSVLLTSHSMDECDSLCSRLAIMVNGQLKCIGSPQHLKHKFGDGYTVILHLQGLSSSRYQVAESFLTHFPGSVIKVSLKLKDQHHSVVEVSIPRGAGSVADIFEAVRDAQAQHQIMYYSVSQTTLDSVFVNFAREQSDDCEHDTEADSSSGASTSGSGDIKDGSFQKSMIGSTYAYMNPQYSPDIDSFSSSQPPKAPSSAALVFENQTYDDAMVTKL